MASLNKILIIGNCGKDPEIKYLPSGVKLAKFSVATSERFKKGEEWEEKTEWHNIVCFNKVAERAERLLKKGTSIYLEGKLSTSMRETEAGEKRYKTEIVANHIQAIANRKEAEEGTSTPAESNPSRNSSTSQNGSFTSPVGDVEPDLPF